MALKESVLGDLDLLGSHGSVCMVVRILSKGFLKCVCVCRDGDLTRDFIVEEMGLGDIVGVGKLGLEEFLRSCFEGNLIKIEDIRFRNGDRGIIIVEVIKSTLQLVVVGAGHVGRAVAKIGRIVGYEVVILDDRRDLLFSEDLKQFGVKGREVKFGSELDANFLDEAAALVIVTRGHQFDEMFLRSVLGSKRNLRYIGMIGSKRRVTIIKTRLLEDGYKREDIERVHAPIGLRIGAVTPPEIAVAIIAEIINETRIS